MSEDTRRITEQLSRYRKTVEKLERLEDRLLVISTKLTSTASPGISDMPHGGTPLSMDDMIAEKIELEKRIEKLREQERQDRQTAIDLVDLIFDPIQSEIVERHYIDGDDFETIADDLGYSDRHIKRLSQEGIACICKENIA